MHNQSFSLIKLSKPNKVAPKLHFIMIMHRRTCLSRVMMLTNEKLSWVAEQLQSTKCKLFNSISGKLGPLKHVPWINTCGRRVCRHCMSERDAILEWRCLGSGSVVKCDRHVTDELLRSKYLKLCNLTTSAFPDFLLQPFRKPKRVRTAFSPTQLLKLEHAFEGNHYVVGAERKTLAQQLGLTETQVRLMVENCFRFRLEKHFHMKIALTQKALRSLTINLEMEADFHFAH